MADCANTMNRAGGMPRRSLCLLAGTFLLLLLILGAGVPSSEAAATMTRRDFVAGLTAARGFQGISGGDPLLAAMEYDLIPWSDRDGAAPITRGEALSFAVHSLGLTHEARLLAGLPLPFKDRDTLSSSARGVAAVALNMKPSLITKGLSHFVPEQKITPAEGKFILNAVRTARKGLLLSVRYAPHRGMSVHITREGTYTTLPQWRAAVNGFDTREEAEVFCAAMIAQGVEATVDSYNYDWRVRTQLFERYSPVRHFLDVASSLGREGVVFSSGAPWEAQKYPRFWITMTFDPSLYSVRPVFPEEGLSVLAPLSGHTIGGAVAAMNGGYFTVTAKDRGAPIGAIMTGGVFVNAPHRGRSTMGWNDSDAPSIGMMDLKITADFPGLGFMEITGINKLPGVNGVILYTEHFGAATPDPSEAVVEMVLRDDMVEEIRRTENNAIPAGAIVLAVYGGPTRYLASVQEGDRVRLTHAIEGESQQWGPVREAVQGGPCILRNGEVAIEDEKLGDAFINKRHPRTAIGYTRDGQWIFFVGDGRSAVHSAGFTLPEVAAILKKAGTMQALNLDGGGSSSIMEGGRVLNVLSDGKERSISYGLGVFRKGGY